jgi:large subunit ribosomal protein L25
MADEIQLAVKPRTVIGKQVNQLRRNGWIPLALYGGHIQPSSLQAEERVLRAVLNKAGHNRLIRLDTGDGGPHVVVAREIQREPITGKILHVDLLEISLTEKMTTDVPVVLQGTSPVVTRGEGLLIHGLEEVTIRVLPTDLIPQIEVDVSTLTELNQTLHVSDLKLGDRIEILTPGDEMLAKVIPVKEEVIVEEAPAAVAEVEIVGKGKKEEEGEGEAEAAEGAAKQPEAKKEEKK